MLDHTNRPIHIRHHCIFLLRELSAFFDLEAIVDPAQMYDLPCELPGFRPINWDALIDVRRRAAKSREKAFAQAPETIFEVMEAMMVALWISLENHYFSLVYYRPQDFNALPYCSFFINHYKRIFDSEVNDEAELLEDDVFQSDDPVQQWLAYCYLVTLLIINKRFSYSQVVAFTSADLPRLYAAQNGTQGCTLEEIGQRFAAWIPEASLPAFRTHWMRVVNTKHRPYGKFFNIYDERIAYPVQDIIRTLAENGCEEAKAALPELDYAYGWYLMPSRSHALYDMMDEYGEADDSYSRKLAYAYKYFKKAADAGHEKAKEALKQF